MSMFQSLTWVERLSDNIGIQLRQARIKFQSLTWVERLSDAVGAVAVWRQTRRCFNPSPGLNVFQTFSPFGPDYEIVGFNPSPGLNVFQTITRAAPVATASCFNPSPGLNVFQTNQRPRRHRRMMVSIPHLG